MARKPTREPTLWRRAASADAARGTFLARHPACAIVADFVSDADSLSGLLTFWLEAARWVRLVNLRAVLPDPPALDPELAGLLAVIGTLDHRLSSTLQLSEQMRTAHSALQLAAAIRAPIPSPPGLRALGRVLRDKRLLVAVVATVLARDVGDILDSEDLALLAVMAGAEAGPVQDEGAYDRLLDRWRKRIGTVRIILRKVERMFGGF